MNFYQTPQTPPASPTHQTSQPNSNISKNSTSTLTSTSTSTSWGSKYTSRTNSLAARQNYTTVGFMTRIKYFFKMCWWDETLLKKISKFIKYALLCHIIFCALYYFSQLSIFYVPQIKIITNGLEIPEKQKQKIMTELSKPVHFFQQMQPFVDIFNEVSAIQSINYQRKFNSLIDAQENSLQFILEKHQPFAKWDQDDYSYISTQGLIYQDFSMPKTELQLSGDESSNALVKMLQNQPVFKEILAPFTIKKVDFKFNIWHIELTQGIMLTFSDEPIDELKNRINRWKIVWNYWQKTNSPHKNAVDFDLRQNNGFSFKDMSLPPSMVHDGI